MQKQTEKYRAEQSGLVVSYFGKSVAIEAEDGQIFQCHLRRNQECPVVGDQVAWHLEQGDTGIVSAILPRRSLLARGDHHGKMKPIAANIDAIMVVMAPPPILSDYLIDRYLLAADLLAIRPIIVVNKIDLLTAAEQKTLQSQLSSYAHAKYPIVFSSIFQPETLSLLNETIHQQAAVLVGPSGVGKSSLIAALGQQEIRTGEVSPKGAGKHTTTATRLYHLPGGGHLIDSPGVREFNLWPVSRQDVLRGFKEFQPFLQDCKFRDCLHLVEPGCAVQAAVENGKISGQRFASYQTLMKEAAVK